MKKLSLKRWTALALCIVMVLACSSLAFGLTMTAVSGYGIITQATDVKTAPGTNYTTLGSLSVGMAVNVTGMVSNGWVQIEYGTAKGYVNGGCISLTTTGGNSNTSGVLGVFYTTSTVKMYAVASTSGTLLATIGAGQQVYKTGYMGGWAQITYGGVSGYVDAAYLVQYTGGSSTGGSTGGSISGGTSGGIYNATGATHSVTAAKLNVRSGPSTKYSKVGYLLAGSTVSRVGTSGKWSKIEYNGGTGYVYSKYLKSLGSSTGGSTSTSGAVYVYAGPGTGYSVVGTLAAGDRVSQLGSSGNWVKVTNGVITGYVEASALTRNTYSTVTTGNYYVNTASLNVRTGPGTNYGILGTVVKGQVLTVTGRSGNWAQITFNGVIAYVHASYLSSASGYYYNGTGGQPLYIFP